MAFICRIDQSAAVIASVPAEFQQDVRDGLVFHTLGPRHGQLLKDLWYRWHGLPSPLRHFWRDEPVIWTEGRGRTIRKAVGKRPAVKVLRPFVKRYPGKAKEDDNEENHSADRERHEWAQMQLHNLGKRLGQNPKLEEVFDGCRIDVVWENAKLAWEVDLTLPTSRTQWHRQRARSDAGFELISLVDAKNPKYSLAPFTTVRVYNLLATCSRPNEAKYRFDQLLVNDLHSLKRELSGFEGLESRQLETFCRALVAKMWEYGRIPGSTSGWARAGHFKRYEDWQALVAERTCAQEALAEATKAPAELAKLKKSLAETEANLSNCRDRKQRVERLLQGLMKLELSDADSRAAFVSTTPKDFVEEEFRVAWIATRDAVASYTWSRFWYHDNREKAATTVRTTRQKFEIEIAALESLIVSTDQTRLRLRAEITMKQLDVNGSPPIASLERKVTAAVAALKALEACHQAELDALTGRLGPRALGQARPPS